MTAVTPKTLPEGIYMFEQPFLRAPNESIKRQFRASQKQVERDMGALRTNARDLSKKTGTSAQDGIAALDTMITKVNGLTKKLEDIHESKTKSNLAVLRARVDHFDELENLDENELENWEEARLNRWLVDWSLRSGYGATAKAIAEDRGVQDLVDISLFEEIERIENALRSKSATEALAWCSDNKNALRKNKSTLEFELRLQEFIELARVKKEVEALTYWAKHLKPWEETHLDRMEQVTALLIMGPMTKCKRYQKLLSDTRWTLLITYFRKAIYQIHALPTEPLLYYALSAGLTSLKVHSCSEKSSFNVNCPLCDEQGLGVLAQEVPFSHHANSTIVCRLSGQIMNEDNPPMAFSNGSVYSLK
ncbi:GID complex subunit containing RING finger motif, partial [Serendipita sp. 407]